MTAAQITEPRMTAKLFLFDDAVGDDSATVIGRAVRARGLNQSALEGLRRLSRSSRDAVNNEIGTVTESLLEIDLGDALVAGWRRYSTFVDAARRTLASPGSEEVLDLASHTVTWSSHPKVDLLLDGLKVNSFEFEITLTFDVTGVAAVISSGSLVALSGGKCVVTARLSLEGAKVAERQRQMDLHIMLRLSSPVSLLLQPSATAFMPRQSQGAADRRPPQPELAAERSAGRHRAAGG